MMKGISDLDKLGPVQPKPADKAGGAVDQDLFRKTFEQALAGVEETVTTPAPSGLGEIRSFGFRLEDSGDQALETGTDRLLTLLDNLASALSDPDRTLKEMDGLVRTIKQEADSLTEAARQRPDGDSLKAVAEESALLAQVEYLKFTRGDYA
ncbi:hypothetical protein JCM14469_21870 [Desulfatiferula olefinivorans]